MYTLYGHKDCRYCHMAREILGNRELEYEYIDIRAEGNEHHLQFLSDNSFETVPQIFLEDEYLGDYNALINYLKI